MTGSSAGTDAGLPVDGVWSRSAAPGLRETDAPRQAWRAYFEATALLQDRLDKTLKDEVGLHLADYNLLLLLTESPEGRLRMGELARLMVFSPSRVTYQVKTLEQRGLVERCAAATDRRGAEAVITDAGRRLFRRAAALHSREVRDLFLDRLEEGEAGTLLRVFSRLGCALEDTVSGSR